MSPSDRASCWASDPGAPPPDPLGTARLLGLRRRRLDLLLTTALLGLVVASRVAALPAGVWEQDEAYLACAVVRLDVAANHPHPPWFPLFVALGKVVHAVGVPPVRSLQLVSLAAGTWMLFPLVSLWSLLLDRRLAVASAVLYLAAPGAWLLAGRAFSGTTATAALVAALAWWLRPGFGRRDAVLGSLAAAAAVLVRPQLTLPVAATVLCLALTRRAPRLALLGPLAAAVGLAAGLLALAAGPRALGAALTEHAAYHLGHLPEASWSFARSGLARALLEPAAAAAWTALAVAGFALLLGSRHRTTAALLVGGALVPLVVVVWGLSNPAHVRYALPLLALTSGAVVKALAALPGRTVAVALTAAVAASVVAVSPALATYRRAPSPPVAALRQATAEVEESGGVLVVDRTLVAFVDLEEMVGNMDVPVLFDHLVEDGSVPPPPPELAVAVFDDGRDALLHGSGRRRIFSCTPGPLRRLSQDRFMDVTVADDPILVDRSLGAGPLVVLE